jgi:hypothetical protein
MAGAAAFGLAACGPRADARVGVAEQQVSDGEGDDTITAGDRERRELRATVAARTR